MGKWRWERKEAKRRRREWDEANAASSDAEDGL